jgi:hypothetical protein
VFHKMQECSCCLCNRKLKGLKNEEQSPSVCKLCLQRDLGVSVSGRSAFFPSVHTSPVSLGIQWSDD